MTFQNEKFLFSDPKFLFYFLPRELKKERIFPLALHSSNQKNVEVELPGFNLRDLQQSATFLSSLENRFCSYEKTAFFENQEFSLSFQAFEKATKSCFFTKRKKRIGSQLGLLSPLQEKESFFPKPKENLLVKSRLLSLSRGGFLSSCFGKAAFVIRSETFSKFQKEKSYKAWFSLNLPYYGFLTYFRIVDFKRLDFPSFRGSRRKSLAKTSEFYYFRNERINYRFLLGKAKNLQKN